MAKDIAWKIGWWWRHWWLGDDIKRRDQHRHFYRMTGLHPCWVNNKSMDELEVIAVQGRRIKGLEQQLNDQRRGYLRKVARLERRIAELEASTPISEDD